MTIITKKSPLGIYTNNSTPIAPDYDSLIAKTPDGDSPDFIRSATKFTMLKSAGNLLPKERVKKCMKFTIAGPVEVKRHFKEPIAHFGNLVRYSSIWHCPCCASQVSEYRKNEIDQIVTTAESRGHQVQMVTLTIPHTRLNKLCDLLSLVKGAMRSMTKPKGWKNFKNNFGWIGDVRALELTHGQSNGWHPHIHCLVIFQKPLTVRQQRSIKKAIYHHWSKACLKVGLDKPSYKHGVDIRAHDALSAYLTKTGWSLASEITKAHVKKAKTGSRSPFQLLADYSITGDKQAGALFVEYAKAIKGYKHLTYSKGLKKEFLVSNKSDSEIVEEELSEEFILFSLIPAELWKSCINARASILQVVKSGDKDVFYQLLSSLSGYSVNEVQDMIFTSKQTFKDGSGG